MATPRGTPQATPRLKDAQVRTPDPVEQNPTPLMPHERDESDDSQASGPREVMQQAYKDIQNGLVDTDLRGRRGVESVVPDKSRRSQRAEPQTKKVDRS
jgi:hypothetical protein